MLSRIDAFHRLEFSTGRAADAFQRRLREIHTDRGRTGTERLVLFAPETRPDIGTINLFASTGVVLAAEILGLSLKTFDQAVALAELPDGLTLVIGGDADAAAYESRRAARTSDGRQRSTPS